MKKYTISFIIWLIYIISFYSYIYYKPIFKSTPSSTTIIASFIIFSILIMPPILTMTASIKNKSINDDELREQTNRNLIIALFTSVPPILISGFFISSPNQNAIIAPYLKDCKEHYNSSYDSKQYPCFGKLMFFYFNNSQITSAIKRYNENYNESIKAKIEKANKRQEAKTKEYEKDTELADYLNKNLSKEGN